MQNRKMTQKTIQANKSALEKAASGDIVKISMAGIDDHEKRRNILTIFKGNSNGNDKFVTQERFEGDYKLVAVYTSPRNTHKYDRKLGVILSYYARELAFIGPRRGKEYEDLVSELNKQVYG